MNSRRRIHFLFLLISLCLFAATVYQYRTLRYQKAILASVAAIPDLINDQTQKVSDLTHWDSPHVQLAYANALAKTHDFDRAETAYTQLIHVHESTGVAIAARYNLANMYLRQGMITENSTNQSRTMLALAKQRYRDLLRSKPEHWHARYNLERALRLAPEGDDTRANERIEPLKQVRVIVPGFTTKDLP